MTGKLFISAQELLEDSFRLGAQIIASGFCPDFIVGIWRGGARQITRAIAARASWRFPNTRRALHRGFPATGAFPGAQRRYWLQGAEVPRCGALQFPPQRVCESCFAKDNFELRRISDRRGKLITWTLDYFYPTPEPPTAVGVVDIEGARVHMQIVNLAAEDLRSGLPLDFHFRCMHRVGGRPNYYWKAAPAES